MKNSPHDFEEIKQLDEQIAALEEKLKQVHINLLNSIDKEKREKIKVMFDYYSDELRKLKGKSLSLKNNYEQYKDSKYTENSIKQNQSKQINILNQPINKLFVSLFLVLIISYATIFLIFDDNSFNHDNQNLLDKFANTISGASVVDFQVQSIDDVKTVYPQMHPFNDTGSGIYISCFDEGGVNFCDINHYNFSVRYVNSINGIYQITAPSKNVENSFRKVGADHNKTVTLQVGDVVDYQVRLDNDSFKDIVFLNRVMFLYSKDGQELINLTTANANSSSCNIEYNNTALVSVICTLTNDDVVFEINHKAKADNSFLNTFYSVINKADVPITLIEYYNYLDCDANVNPGYESLDTHSALIQHLNGPDQEEQISKEAYVVCDSHGLYPEDDLSKCSEAVGDSFFVLQSTEGGENGDNGAVYCGFNTKLSSASEIDVEVGFVNPTTDTDGIDEVPPATIKKNDNSPLNRADLTLAYNLKGATIPVGGKYVKFFGLIGEETVDSFSEVTDEEILGTPIDLINDQIDIRKTSDSSVVTSVGPYIPFNITAEIANTVGENITDASFFCVIAHESGDLISFTNTTFTLTPVEAVRTFQCGDTFNLDNTLLPGDYFVNLTVIGDVNTEYATNSFTILSDYIGNSNVSLDKNLTKCNDIITLTINTTNQGNTNFTSNYLVDLYHENNSFVKTIFNQDVLLLKNEGDFREIEYQITECTSSHNYTIRTSIPTFDEINGTVIYDTDNSYYDDNINPSNSFSLGYEQASAIFKRFYTIIDVDDDYELDTCLLELTKDLTTPYVMEKVGNNCYFDLNLTNNGKYSFQITVNDTIGNENKTASIEIEKFFAQGHSEFIGPKTTNFYKDIRNVYYFCNLVLETNDGLIEWNECVNLVNQDFDDSIDIINNHVSVNSETLNEMYNSSANVTYYDLTEFMDPRIKLNYSNNLFDCPHCNRLSYDKSLGDIVYMVDHFSTYTVIEGTKLEIFDDNDTEASGSVRFSEDNTWFYANYSNSTDGPIISDGSSCSISWNITGNWTDINNLTYNSSSELYEINYTFIDKGEYQYNISCISQTNTNISLIDYIPIANWIPTPPDMITPLNLSSTINRTLLFIWNNSVEKDFSDEALYHIMIDDNPNFNNPEVNVSNISKTNENFTEFIPDYEFDVDIDYYWKIRGYDTEDFGEFTEDHHLTIDSYLSLSLVQDSISFGYLDNLDIRNTSKNDPPPFLVENTGNIFTNISIIASSFFTSVEYPSEYYQFKVRENESNSFDVVTSKVNWIFMDNTSTDTDIFTLDWHYWKNTFYTDLLIKVPPEERAGSKSSFVVFTAES